VHVLAVEVVCRRRRRRQNANLVPLLAEPLGKVMGTELGAALNVGRVESGHQQDTHC